MGYDHLDIPDGSGWSVVALALYVEIFSRRFDADTTHFLMVSVLLIGIALRLAVSVACYLLRLLDHWEDW